MNDTHIVKLVYNIFQLVEDTYDGGGGAWKNNHKP